MGTSWELSCIEVLPPEHQLPSAGDLQTHCRGSPGLVGRAKTLGKTPKLQRCQLLCYDTGSCKAGGHLGSAGRWGTGTPHVSHARNQLPPCSSVDLCHALFISQQNGGKTKALSDCVYFLAAGACTAPPGPRTEGLPPPHLPLNPEQGAAWEGADVNSPFSAWMEMLIKSRVIKHLEAREPGRAGRHDALQLPLAAP